MPHIEAVREFYLYPCMNSLDLHPTEGAAHNLQNPYTEAASSCQPGVYPTRDERRKLSKMLSEPVMVRHERFGIPNHSLLLPHSQT